MIAIVLGTRPEIIKCAPVVLEAVRRKIPIEIIHTGQHYSPELDGNFFAELELPAPIAHVHVGSHPAARQVGLMIQGLADALEERKPSVVLVQGDTNTVLAGALAAHKMNIPIAHLEAGLRSDDWDMPEEGNRVLTDRLSRWLFCPTEIQRERLRGEGIVHDGVRVVGNTIVDASLHYAEIAKEKSVILDRFALAGKPFVLLTMHRPSNVDDPVRLQAMLNAIGQAASSLGYTVVFPIHPRTRATVERGGLSIPSSFLLIDPIGYIDLLRLQMASEMILTDSGGVQEEACILRVPSITLRSTTERPETLHVGASVLFHEPNGDALAEIMRTHGKKERTWENPFGDGKTAARVLDILKDV